MKKYLWMAIGAIALLTVVSAPAFAANSASFNVTISIATSADIMVTGGPIDFGIKGANSSAVSSNAIVVKNTGSGSTETYSLSLSDPSGWTSVTTAPDFDKYRLSAAFATTADVVTWGTANALTTVSTPASTTQFAGDKTGSAVPYNEERSIWLKIETPTGTSSPSQKTIAVTLSATVD
ncbi:MAG: hypothetical protein PHS46_07655 [Candidatus Omnitrophica bacterium]|nr:hypothetical protein [Candidatus Omnitrophota bacterium]